MFTLAIPDSFCACSATKIIQDGASVHTQERLWRRNREEKSLRHVAIVAKFLDDNKPIKSLKSPFALFQTLPILFSFNFCVVFTYSIKRAREIRKSHVVVVQRRQRNVQNSVMYVQSCCLLR